MYIYIHVYLYACTCVCARTYVKVCDCVCERERERVLTHASAHTGGQPDNQGGNEWCVEMVWQGKMKDVRCDSRLPFICKRVAMSGQTGIQ